MFINEKLLPDSLKLDLTLINQVNSDHVVISENSTNAPYQASILCTTEKILRQISIERFSLLSPLSERLPDSNQP